MEQGSQLLALLQNISQSLLENRPKNLLNFQWLFIDFESENPSKIPPTTFPTASLTIQRSQVAWVCNQASIIQHGSDSWPCKQYDGHSTRTRCTAVQLVNWAFNANWLLDRANDPLITGKTRSNSSGLTRECKKNQSKIQLEFELIDGIIYNNQRKIKFEKPKKIPVNRVDHPDNVGKPCNVSVDHSTRTGCRPNLH